MQADFDCCTVQSHSSKLHELTALCDCRLPRLGSYHPRGLSRPFIVTAGAATGTVESRSIVDPVRKYVCNKVCPVYTAASRGWPESGLWG